MHVAGNSSTETIAKRILASLKQDGTCTLEAIGSKALEKATQALEQAQEWMKETYPTEHSRHTVDADGKPKTVLHITIYR